MSGDVGKRLCSHPLFRYYSNRPWHGAPKELKSHDIGYAVYRNMKTTGHINERRLAAALSRIEDLDLFLLFCICDSCTASKGREMIRWFVDEVRRSYPVWVGPQHILPGADVTAEGAW